MMFQSLLALVCGLVVVASLAGCAKSPEALGADANLSFDGHGDGTQREQAKCDSDARFGGNGHVADGSVTIRVTDADGSQLFAERYQGDFDVATQTLTGNEGTWTIEATRSGNDIVGDEFSGRYAFFVNC